MAGPPPGQFSQAQLRSLRDRPLIPTRLGLRPTVTVIPGGFADPLGIAAEVSPDIVKGPRTGARRPRNHGTFVLNVRATARAEGPDARDFDTGPAAAPRCMR